jgi:hypothetical protein
MRRGVFPARSKTCASLEIGAIHRMSQSLLGRLKRRDPLSDKVHHSRWEALGFVALGAAGALGGRIARR